MHVLNQLCHPNANKQSWLMGAAWRKGAPVTHVPKNVQFVGSADSKNAKETLLHHVSFISKKMFHKELYLL